MPYFGGISLSLIVQVFFAIHAARTRRYGWIFIILFFPFVGSLIYLFSEYLPDMQNNVSCRNAGTRIKKVLAPNGKIRELEKQLQITDSLQNRENLARAYADAGRYQDGIDLLEPSLQGRNSNDPHLLGDLCHFHFSMENYEKTRDYLARLTEVEGGRLSDKLNLLKARTHEGLKEYDAALAVYKVLAETFHGEEARCRYALLLKELGKQEEARNLFETIKTNCRLSTNFYKKMQKKWADIAKVELQSARQA
jgi:hypothetical protein